MENCGDISSRKRRKPYIRKLCLALAMLAAVSIVWLIISVNNSMRPALANLAETRINSIATEAMNQAITESLNSGSDYDCLITSYDNGEKVYMLQADARRMNLLASECCAAAQKRIAEVGEQGVSLPLGTVSGITYLTGRGPRIIKVSSEAAIAESIIVGEVPQVYTNVESTDDMLNLIPTEPLD